MHYWQNFSGPWAQPTWGPGFLMGLGGILFLAVIIWSVIWKGMALWKAARRGDKGWFVALLLINTLGILDILYLYVFSERSKPVEKSN